MAQKFQRLGCKDKLATNYDSTATVQCSDCCKYTIDIGLQLRIEGCKDKLASNYNPNADIECKRCCQYTEPERPIIIYEEYVIPEPQYYNDS